MPPPLLLDLDRISADSVEYDHDAIYRLMPHRYEFSILSGVYFIDREAGTAAAWTDCGVDDWWCRGHIPEQPIFPGVLQVEAGAQLVAFISRYSKSFQGFIVFSGVERCRFRKPVLPPVRLTLLARMTADRTRRVTGDVQGVVDGTVVFEASIAGMTMPE